MCGRFTLHLPIEVLAEIFGTSIIQDVQLRYNIAPTQQVLAVRQGATGKEIVLLRWGLIPSWAKELNVGQINARSETVDVKPSFKNALKHRRCIIPANGFYEWQEVRGKKHPIYVRLKNNNPMMFAGLWDQWKSPVGKAIESCTILTTTSNDLLNPLHDRMPLILDSRDYESWLDTQVKDLEQLKPLFKPFPSELIEMYQVSDLANSARNDTPECIKPVER